MDNTAKNILIIGVLAGVGMVIAQQMLAANDASQAGADASTLDPTGGWGSGYGGQTDPNSIAPDAADGNQGVDTGGFTDYLTPVYYNIKGALGMWRAPQKYAGTIAATEQRYGIPSGLLERLLYQESHYRQDIITGAIRSAAGALGIAQFLPKTAAMMGFNPLDPIASINAAGKYLAQLYQQFGSWTYALQAYNWGPGNMKAYLATGAGAHGQPMPQETQDYASQIVADASQVSPGIA